ncbi:MAG: hypothetical protein AAGF85_19320 [Bacteroidota bacterium]
MKKHHAQVGDNIKDWRASDILKFQEDLEESVNGRVSEKWFYTHMKSQSETIPRIDILDLLSTYVGYKNWKQYKKVAAKSSIKRQVLLIVVVVSIVSISLVFFTLSVPVAHTYEFCFINGYTKEPLRSEELEVRLLKYQESSQVQSADDQGCVKITGSKGKVRLVISAQYYQKDTITRILDSTNSYEKVLLIPDDFALMIRSFSQSNSGNWETRRKMLQEMIASSARIYRMYDNQNAMQVYNKQEFIDKIIIPSKSFKNVEVIRTVYEMDQVVELRFLQANTE